MFFTACGCFTCLTVCVWPCMCWKLIAFQLKWHSLSSVFFFSNFEWRHKKSSQTFGAEENLFRRGYDHVGNSNVVAVVVCSSTHCVLPFGFINFSLNFIVFFRSLCSLSALLLLIKVFRTFFLTLSLSPAIFVESLEKFIVRMFHVKRYVIVVSPQTFYYFCCSVDFNVGRGVNVRFQAWAGVVFFLPHWTSMRNAKLFANCDNAWKSAAKVKRKKWYLHSTADDRAQDSCYGKAVKCRSS